MNDLRTGTRDWIGSVGRVVRQPVLRRVLPGMLVSALGDGMSMVAVAWLAVQIAPPDQAGVWTGLAVAAYALPAPVGAALLARLVRRFRGAQLVAVDAALRAVALGLVAILAVAGLLNPVGYVALLAVSSLLHAWGSAGAYTLVAELLPDEDRVTGNALLSTFTQAAVVVGPALAGGLTALVGPGWVIGADAASFAVLAASCWAATRRRAGPAQTTREGVAPAAPAAAAGGRWLAHHPRSAPAARVDRGDLCLLLSLRPGRGGAAGPRRPRAARLAWPAGSVLDGVRHRGHPGRSRRRTAPAPSTVAGRGRHHHRLGRRPAAARADRRGRARAGGVRGRRLDLRAVHRHLHRAVPAQHPTAGVEPRTRRPFRAHHPLHRTGHVAGRTGGERDRRPPDPAALRPAHHRARGGGSGCPVAALPDGRGNPARGRGRRARPRRPWRAHHRRAPACAPTDTGSRRRRTRPRWRAAAAGHRRAGPPPAPPGRWRSGCRRPWPGRRRPGPGRPGAR